jgi:flagellar FliL protein
MANAEEAPQPTKKSLLIPILITTNLLAIAGIVVVLVLGPKLWAQPTEPEKAEEEQLVESATLGPTVDIGNFTINLSDPGPPRYLKAVVKGTVSSERTQAEVQARNPQLRDVILSYLSSLTLKDTQGARAKQTIRDNLRKRINNLLRTGEIEDIFFTDFVTQ